MPFFELTPFEKQLGFDLHGYIWQQVLNQQEANKYCGTTLDQAMCDYLNPFKTSKSELEELAEYYESLEHDNYIPELLDEINQEYHDNEDNDDDEFHRSMEEDNQESSESDSEDEHYDYLD